MYVPSETNFKANILKVFVKTLKIVFSLLKRYEISDFIKYLNAKYSGKCIIVIHYELETDI